LGDRRCHSLRDRSDTRETQGPPFPNEGETGRKVRVKEEREAKKVPFSAMSSFRGVRNDERYAMLEIISAERPFQVTENLPKGEYEKNLA